MKGAVTTYWEGRARRDYNTAAVQFFLLFIVQYVLLEKFPVWLVYIESGRYRFSYCPPNLQVIVLPLQTSDYRERDGPEHSICTYI